MRFIVTVLVLVVVVVGVSVGAGCGGGTKGTFQSMSVSFSSSGAPTYTGTIQVKLGDGTTVNVACPNAAATTLKGGQTVTIKKTSSGSWTFVSAK